MALEVIQLLRDMIAIPSVNPMRSPSGVAVERELADYLESTLRRAGIDCERQAVDEGRENVVAIVQASGPGGSDKRGGLMLNSHMDTVPVANMTIDPFDPIVRDGRIYGRGAGDAKGSIAAMIATIVAHANKPERPVPVVFAAMADEEFSFAGGPGDIAQAHTCDEFIEVEQVEMALALYSRLIAQWPAASGPISERSLEFSL